MFPRVTQWYPKERELSASVEEYRVNQNLPKRKRAVASLFEALTADLLRTASESAAAPHLPHSMPSGPLLCERPLYGRPGGAGSHAKGPLGRRGPLGKQGATTRQFSRNCFVLRLTNPPIDTSTWYEAPPPGAR